MDDHHGPALVRSPRFGPQAEKVLSGIRPLVICGPSGSGKSTVVRELVACAPSLLAQVVSVTTRPPRPGEMHAGEYEFVSDSQFERVYAAGGFLESAGYAGHRYATPISALLDVVSSRRLPVLVLELSGAESVSRKLPGAFSVMLDGDLDELASRLAGRGDDPDSVAVRLSVAERELALGPTSCDLTLHMGASDLVPKLLDLAVSLHAGSTF